MEFTEYVRKPFTVEAVEITEENLYEAAEFIGTIRKTDEGRTYIQVDRRLIPNVDRVYPGFWMTRIGGNVRCYSAKIFKEQFTKSTPEIQAWITHISQKDTSTQPSTSTTVDL
jgi:hypothetical protein